MEFFEVSASTSNNISEVSVTLKQPVQIVQKLPAAFLFCLFSCFLQSFHRLTELVLQAHKRDVDNFFGSLDEYLDQAALESEKGSQEKDNKTQSTCAC